MNAIQSPHVLCTEQGVSDEYRRMVKSRMPHMAALLDIMDSGKTPNFLDILTAISDIVAFYTERDSNSVDPVEKNILMSGNFCRFCS